jgi:hypothetical protein
MRHSDLDPGRPVFGRLGFWILAVLLIGAGVGIAASSRPEQPPRFTETDSPIGGSEVTAAWAVGSCVSGSFLVEPISCSAPHDGMIVALERYESECPVTADSYVEDGGSVWCIDDDR